VFSALIELPVDALSAIVNDVRENHFWETSMRCTFLAIVIGVVVGCDSKPSARDADVRKLGMEAKVSVKMEDGSTINLETKRD
jgi:hypothetical protein